MKKLVALFVIAGMVSFVACGPKKDKEADQKKLDSLKADSLAKVEKAQKEADSLALVAKADSLKQDSIAKAEEKGGKKDGKKDDKKVDIKGGRG